MALNLVSFLMRTLMQMLIGLTAVVLASAADRPNILWLTSEDNSHTYIGAYGNPNAHTPRSHKLAAEGVRFNHAYSNAPVCAVARSTILTGVHAPSQGTHHMRSRYPIPASFTPYATYLREAGYHCTNIGKMVYYFDLDFVEIWDQTVWFSFQEGAHYRNRSPGQPFFSVFNLRPTHESRLFPENIADYRSDGRIPPVPRVALADIDLPDFLPDEPIFREDIAIYHDYITLMDSQAGTVLDELEAEGLAEDTIVVYYADHGGVTPRSKRWLYDTGTRVPFIIYVPEKWQHLSPYAPGSVVEEPVSFVDLVPTLLKLAGIELPDHLQGQPLLGEGVTPPNHQYALLYGDRFDERQKMRRAITDGAYRYMLNFVPQAPGRLDIEFPYTMRSWQRWKDLAEAGELDPSLPNYFEGAFPGELLFHTDEDPWEVENLAADSGFAERKKELRGALVAELKQINDLGFVPEAMFHEFSQPTMHEAVRDSGLKYHEVIDYAVAVALSEIGNQSLLEGLRDQNPLIRYWSAVGLRNVDLVGEEVADQLRVFERDESVANRIMAATLMHQIGDAEAAREVLLTDLYRYEQDEVLRTILEAIDVLGLAAAVDTAWLKEIDARYDRKFYHHRLARLILAKQGGSN